jgi:hypothetical protein
MDRALILVTLAFALFFFIAREGSRMSKERWHQIMIAVFTFSCCFARLYIPYVNAGGEDSQGGSFGPTGGIWPFYAMSVWLLWIIAVEKRWRIRRPKLLVIFICLAYAGYTLANPYCTSRIHTLIEVIYWLSFAVFIYMFANCFSVKTVVKGIYMGLAATATLHLLLAICYPLLNIEFVVKLFDSDATTRSEERVGAVGTMGHPNVLGTYASYYFNFFIACFLTNFKRRQSGIFAGMAFLVIILSASRSALAASVLSLLAVVVFYVYRRYKLLSLQSFLKAIVPMAILIALLVSGPLNFLFSDVENLDEMTFSRLMHYYCGYEIFMDHPLVGVSMNNHLFYLTENTSAAIFEEVFDMSNVWRPEEYFFITPIHNIWIIMIDELGLIGYLPIMGLVIYYIATFKRRTHQSTNRYYNIINITALGIVFCQLTQGSSDWAPLSPHILNLSLLFIVLSLNNQFRTEVHPEFETVEEARRQALAQEAAADEDSPDDDTNQAV